MSRLHFENLAFGLVVTPPSSPRAGTTLTPTPGVKWPTTPFMATVGPAAEAATQGNSEIVEVTAEVAGTFTIHRAAEGPAGAREIKAGDVIVATITRGQLESLESNNTSPQETATVYVRTDGNDENDGATWGTAVETIPKAISLLPTTGEKLPSGELNRVGTVNLGVAIGGASAFPAFKVKSKIEHEERVKFYGKNTGNPYELFIEGKWRKQKGSPWVQVNLPGQPKLASEHDIGKLMVNPRAPLKPFEQAEIIDFWEGEIGPHGSRVVKAGTGKQWYTMATNIVKTSGKEGGVSTTEFMMLIVTPAIKLGCGVQLVGRGMVGGPGGRKSTKAATVICDEGTGLTVHIEGKTPNTPTETRTRVADISFIPPEENRRLWRKEAKHESPRPLAGEYAEALPIWALMFHNVFGVMVERVEILGYTGWGIFAGNNAGVELKVQDTKIHECGNIEGKIGRTIGGQLTGNLFMGKGLNVSTIVNCNFLNGYGCCASVVGAHLVGNTYNHSVATFWEGKQIAETGTGLLIGKGVPSNIVGGWLEGSEAQTRNKGYVTYIGVHFQGIPGEGATPGEEDQEEGNYAYSAEETYEPGDIVEVGGKLYENIEACEGVRPPNALFWEEVLSAQYACEGGGVFINCTFQRYSKACIKEVASLPIEWLNCRIGQPHSERVRGLPFVERSGSAANVPLFAAFGRGRVGGKEVVGGEVLGGAVETTPSAQPEEVALVGIGGGGTYTNAGGFDVYLEVPIIAEAGATVTRSHTNGEWTQAYPAETYPQARNCFIPTIRVKSGETVTLGLVKATVNGGKAIVRWA